MREAEVVINDGVIRGFKFHPTMEGFLPNDDMAYPLYEAIARLKLPAMFHSGDSAIGTCRAAAGCG